MALKLKEAVGKLKRLKATLEMPVAFYRESLPGWRALAAEITRQALVMSQPVEADRDLWAAQMQALIEKISARLLAAPMVGALLCLKSEEWYEDLPTDSPSNYTVEELGIHDIERWVEAGRGKADADEPGKNLDARDANKSDLQIAWRVMFAIVGRKDGYERLLGHIQQFLAVEQKGAIGASFELILQMWVEAFTIRAWQDWQAWVVKQCAAI